VGGSIFGKPIGHEKGKTMPKLWKSIGMLLHENYDEEKLNYKRILKKIAHILIEENIVTKDDFNKPPIEEDSYDGQDPWV
jgi:hypothetical protein